MGAIFESAEREAGRQRAAMVDSQLRARGIRDERVLQAMGALPRHWFVAGNHAPFAYDDTPLPIAAGQTISQPYMVAVMTEALSVAPSTRVLEVGTGSGYQAAVLAMLGASVVTVEREAELVAGAHANLERVAQAGFIPDGAVEVIAGDGSEGYEPGAPYNAILVAAAAPALPPSLVAQLADGGRLCIPIGGLDYQDLLLVLKTGDQTASRVINQCRFVPLVGKQGWRDGGAGITE
jgi:protein-L-isoaspartate(D-aspartate) O-methyltransferase